MRDTVPVSRGFFVSDRRLASLKRTFEASFGRQPACFVSAPGRTELGGNHTDHQGGRVLAAAVNLDMLGCAAPNGTTLVRVSSAGYRPFTVDLAASAQERSGTSAALVQGVAHLAAQAGYAVGGVDICLQSDVPTGAGLSSSAAFEVLVGQLLNTLFCGDALTPVQLAQMAQAAENQWFGKPCGLMDQLSCAVGGAVAIDFSSAAPAFTKLAVDSRGYTLYIVEVGAGHQQLTAQYAAIPADMAAVAAFFGKERLSQVAQGDFWDNYRTLRRRVGDRPVLRAAHFFGETRRAAQQAEALADGDFEKFLSLVRQSGHSSSAYLQNSYVTANDQPMTAALALSEHLLDGRGACRVHGGGFGGTMQAWVPADLSERFAAVMGETIGPCHRLTIRDIGVVTLR